MTPANGDHAAVEPTERQRLMHGELAHLIEEALSQLDHGYAVDVERQSWDFVRRWSPPDNPRSPRQRAEEMVGKALADHLYRDSDEEPDNPSQGAGS